MARPKVRILDQGAIRMHRHVVVACCKVDVVHVKWTAMDVQRVGVVAACVILLAGSSGWRGEDPHPGELAVVTVQLQDVVGCIEVQGVGKQGVLHVRKVDQFGTKFVAVAPPHQAIAIKRARSSDGQMLQVGGGHNMILSGPVLAVVRNLEDRPLLEVQLSVASRESYRGDGVFAWARNDHFSALGVV